MSKKLSFSIAVNLLTENFKKGTNTVKNSLRSMQMQVLTFAAALGAGGLGLSGLITRFKDVARETSRVLTALKNVSNGTKGFAENLRFVNDMAKKYGLEVNALIGNFAKFTASATQANMPMQQQRKVFESLSRASTAFGLSAEDTNGVFLALSQMMGKGKISSEELRKQMGERIPIAMQAMAKAAGVSMAGLEKLLKQGKLMSSEVIPKFADALNEMIPNVDTDNLESSLNRLKNTFSDIVNSSGFQNKYKELIDGLTSLLQSASKNIQNIIVGIVAAIGFVVTNGLTKVYRGYEATGKQIIANATVTHNKLRAAIAARLEVEKKLEELKLQHSQEIGRKQVSLANQIEKQKQLLSAKTAQVNAAHENAKAAAAQAAAIKSRGAWATAFAAITGSAIRLRASIISLWNTFAPAIVISGLIAIGGYLKNLYDKTKRIEKVTEDYNADVEKETININILFNRLKKATEGTDEYNKAKNGILSKYGEYLKGLSAEIKSLKDVEGAYKAISAAAIQAAKDRAIERGTDEATDDYLKIYKRNASNLKKTLEKEFGKEKGTSLFDSVVEQISTTGNIDKDTKAIIDSLNKTYTSAQGTAGVATTYTVNKADMAISQIVGAKNRLDKQIEEITSIFGKPSSTGTVDEVTTPTGTEPDDKALRAAEKRLEAQRWLDEKDRVRQIEKQKFDLDLQQETIDLMNDSFEKRTKQTLLNLEKEKLEIESFQNDLLKDQTEYAKRLYERVYGTDKGFGEYFATLQKNGFKENGVDIMPEGLRPDDIAAMVEQRLQSVHKAFERATAIISEDSAKLIERERMVFESELKQTISSIKSHYEELKKQYVKGSAEYQKLQHLEEKEIELARLAHNRKVLESETELHEKQIELTGKYYLLQSKKEYELLKLRQKSNQELIKNLKQEFKVVTGKDFDSLSANELRIIINEYPELITSIQVATLEQKRFNMELENIPVKSIKEVQGIISGVVQELSRLDGDLGSFFSEVGSQMNNIETAFDKEASGVDRISAGISGLVSIINMLTSANKARKQAEKEYYRNAIAFAHEYALALNDQLRLYSANSESGFVKDYAGQLNDGYKALEDAVNNYHESIGKLSEGKVKVDLVNAIDWGNVGKGAAAGAAVGAAVGSVVPVIGTAIGAIVGGAVGFIAGLFGGKKKKNEFAGLLDVFPGLVDGAGNLNRELAETLVNTEQVDDNTKQLIQNALDWADAVEEANNQIKEIVLELAGDLGNDLRTAIVDAWKAGKDAALDMFKAAGKSLEGFIEKMLYSAVFGDLFKQFENDLISSLNPLTGDGDIVDDYVRLMQGMDQLDDVYIALLESIKNRPETEKFGLWKPDNQSNTQDSTKGYSVSMDQDTGGAILGRITGMQESMIAIKSMLSALNMDTGKYLTQTIFIGDELKRHTGILYEIQQVQVKSYRLSEKMNDGITSLLDIKDDISAINKNTKGLI